MIKHYLKVALRNLMNFKVHSLISAICLAIGITCFSMMNYFIDAISLNGYYIIQYIPEHSFAIVRTRTKAVHYRTITSGYPWILNRSFCKKRYIRNLILNIESDKFIGRIQWKNPVDGDVFIPFSIVSLCVV